MKHLQPSKMDFFKPPSKRTSVCLYGKSMTTNHKAPPKWSTERFNKNQTNISFCQELAFSFQYANVLAIASNLVPTEFILLLERKQANKKETRSAGQRNKSCCDKIDSDAAASEGCPQPSMDGAERMKEKRTSPLPTNCAHPRVPTLLIFGRWSQGLSLPLLWELEFEACLSRPKTGNQNAAAKRTETKVVENSSIHQVSLQDAGSNKKLEQRRSEVGLLASCKTPLNLAVCLGLWPFSQMSPDEVDGLKKMLNGTYAQ